MTNRVSRWKPQARKSLADFARRVSPRETFRTWQFGSYVIFTRFVLIGAFLSSTFLCGGCGLETPAPDRVPNALEIREAKAKADRDAFVERVRPQVKTFCADCHAMPRPASTSRDEWVEEVNQGFVLYGESGRSDLEVPNYDDVLKFFQYQAPETVSFPESILGHESCPINFDPQSVRFPGSRPPGVTNIRWIDIGLGGSPALVYCDIGTGAILAHWPGSDGGTTKRLATLLQPVHTEPCDLDSDGNIDLIVADIGEFNANDSNLGRIVWLRRLPESEKFEAITLLEGISRVSDVQPADFDGDGDTDLMAGIFGWRKTGRIVMLVNEGPGEDGTPRFTEREIDSRHGASNVPPIDFNGDGKLDFITLFSQEHERVELFLNQGDGNFKNELIWAAPDPAYGSSGIELVDMDLDGDVDILYTNGDSFDRGPKPHHSVQWLENQGELPFVHHHLCHMPGVINAKAADFDGDGDLDVVAGSLLAGSVREQFKKAKISSIAVLIQESPGVFVPTQLESSAQLHLSIATADFDGNGKEDFAIGNYVRESEAAGELPDLVIWWNR